jgi:hypothetical protein
LKALTAVELMPVLESDPSYGANYWGYDPLGFFPPKASNRALISGGGSSAAGARGAVVFDGVLAHFVC